MQSVSTQIGGNQRQALQAMAQYGSQGVQAYQNAQDQIKASQQAALNSAIQQATSYGANPAAIGQITAALDAGYGGRVAGLQANQAAFQANNAGQQGTANNYFSQAQSSLPFLQNETNIQGAKLQQTAQQQAIDNALKEQTLQLDLQKAQNGGQLSPYDQFLEQQALAKQQDPNSIIAAQGGAGLLGNNLYNVNQQQSQQDISGAMSDSALGYAQANPDTGYANAGSSLGLPPGMAQQLGGQSPDAQNASYQSAYNDFSNAINGLGPDGTTKIKALTPQDAYNRLVQAYGPAVADKVATEYKTVKAF